MPRGLTWLPPDTAFELCTSELLLVELLDVLSRDKFAARLAQAGLSPTGIVDELRHLAVVVPRARSPRGRRFTDSVAGCAS